jgi:integrase
MSKPNTPAVSLSLDPALAEVLLPWRRRTRFKNPEDWVFASPYVGGKLPWYPWGVERRHIIPASIRRGIGRMAGTRSAILSAPYFDETGSPMKSAAGTHASWRHPYHDERLRQAMDESKRAAHGKVVSLLLPSRAA